MPLGRIVTGAVIVALAAVSGCGGSGKGARAKVTLPKELIGTWTRTFTKSDVRSTGFPTGTYTLKIRGGELDVYEGSGADPTKGCGGQVGVCASIELTGSSGRILTLGKTPTCTGVGRYAFVVRRDTLTTKKVQDGCAAGRPSVFNDRTWKRAQ